MRQETGLTNTPSERKSIMDKVIKGWEKETKELIKKNRMSKKQSRDYIREYKKKSIFDRIDDIPYGALANVDAEVLRIKKRMLKQIRKEGQKKSV